jgi:hypothetical protein
MTSSTEEHTVPELRSETQVLVLPALQRIRLGSGQGLLHFRFRGLQ